MARGPLVFLLLTVMSCACLFPGECESKQRTLQPGEAVQGVSPDVVVDRLLGTHAGTLTWTLGGRTSDVSVEVTRTGPAVYDEAECGDPARFTIPAHFGIHSGDDLIADEIDFTLEFDAHGVLQPVDPFDVPVEYKALYDAGLTEPTTIECYCAKLSITLGSDLAPQDTTVNLEYDANPVVAGILSFD